MAQIQLFDSKIQKLVTIDSIAYIKARDEYCKRKNINKSGFASDFSFTFNYKNIQDRKLQNLATYCTDHYYPGELPKKPESILKPMRQLGKMLKNDEYAFLIPVNNTIESKIELLETLIGDLLQEDLDENQIKRLKVALNTLK
ncbi:hypothetical protein [uncultured Holdemanella sp.]|jgi:hypothetical protein|uniref:hypothetical protein n=1 Tax=uncultured Holdemanella sp. TaxID=1763549 RepID=UPI0025E617FB|nr:hypothetical protein [uncultured Holdemanella sp.]